MKFINLLIVTVTTFPVDVLIKTISEIFNFSVLNIINEYFGIVNVEDELKSLKLNSVLYLLMGILFFIKSFHLEYNDNEITISSRLYLLLQYIIVSFYLFYIAFPNLLELV